MTDQRPPRDNLVRAIFPGVEYRETSTGAGTLHGHFAVFDSWMSAPLRQMRATSSQNMSRASRRAGRASRSRAIHVVSPQVRNDRAFWDPTHVRFIHPMNYYYLDAGWRAANHLEHYTSADFEVLVQSYQGESDDIAARADEAKAYAHAHYWNSMGDLVVELKRR